MFSVFFFATEANRLEKPSLAGSKSVHSEAALAARRIFVVVLR
jgi:hypothetical protein